MSNDTKDQESLTDLFNNLPPYKYDPQKKEAHYRKISGFIVDPTFSDYVNHENFGVIERMSHNKFLIAMDPIAKDGKYYLLTGEEIDMNDLGQQKKLFTLIQI